MTVLIATQSNTDVLVANEPSLRITATNVDTLFTADSNLRNSSSFIDVLVSTEEYTRPNNESIFGKIDVNNVSFSYTKTGSVGEGNFATRKLFIGSRGGSTNYFNGEISDLIIRTKESTDSELTNVSNNIK